MATGENGKLIKEEVESAGDDNITNNSEETFDALEIVIPKKEFEPEHIKIEDVNNLAYHDLKFENYLDEVKEEFHCEVCGGGLSSPTNFFSSNSWETRRCNCQCQYEYNAMQSENTRDLKPSFGSVFFYRF
ncbi:uncharacterized protein isoform X2 [Leptinotarsa decemlineata]|uniref:uncharacterized protein isoform X2 n=1 Tax=Leptinotarsa decemlineata TaxID=7539 RepID=UPI003D30C8AF